MIELLPAVARGVRLFSRIDCEPIDSPRGIHVTEDMPKEAPSLLLDSASSFAEASPLQAGYLRRRWQQRYLTALAWDFNGQIQHRGALTVALGTAPLVHTSTLVREGEALIFFDLREGVLLATLAQRLRHVCELVYTPSGLGLPSTPLHAPEQSHFHSLGLTCLAALGAAMDTYHGRPAIEPPQVRALAFLADRMNEGIRSLSGLAGLSRIQQEDVEAGSFPTWDPLTPAFVLAHEFGHLFTGSPLREGGFANSMNQNLYSWRTWADSYALAPRLAMQTVDDLQRYDEVTAEQCRQGLTDLQGASDLKFETFADVVAAVAATSLLGEGEISLDCDGDPVYPPHDLFGWYSTAVAVALMHATRMIGAELTRIDAVDWTSSESPDFSRALGAYLLRSHTAVVAMTMAPQKQSEIEDRMTVASGLILAGMQCLAEIRAGVETALRGVPLHEVEAPKTEVAKGARMFGVRLGDATIDTHRKLAEEPLSEQALLKIEAAHREALSTLFDIGGQPFEARYRDVDLSWLPRATLEEHKRDRWE